MNRFLIQFLCKAAARDTIQYASVRQATTAAKNRMYITTTTLPLFVLHEPPLYKIRHKKFKTFSRADDNYND